MKIGLLGFGCVGKGSYQILKEKHQSVIVEKILVKDKTKERPSGIPITFDSADIISNPEITLIIEAIDDAKTAFVYALEILQEGKTLVTANKKMIAENLPLLINTARKYDGRIYYDAAVCGSIPIIQNINTYYRSEKIKSITGILNGSTNYILTLMSEEGLSYKEALSQAQVKGFAESDPTLDVEGYDAANKLSILCYEAFGQYVAPNEITCTGITTITKATLAQAKQENKKIKLIARAEWQNGRLITSVKPEVIKQDNPLFNIDNEYNSVLIEGKYAGLQQLTGKGAGSFPTGLAVAGDVIKALSVTKDNYEVTV